MKKGFLFLSLSLLVFSTIAQQNQVQNTNNALRAGELDRAKIAIDLASEHESTKNLTKMWLYRGENIFRDL